MSPSTYAQEIETPLLILHSENDLRCPIEQGEHLFNLLRLLRKDVEMVRFPAESHELSRCGLAAAPRHALRDDSRMVRSSPEVTVMSIVVEAIGMPASASSSWTIRVSSSVATRDVRTSITKRAASSM